MCYALNIDVCQHNSQISTKFLPFFALLIFDRVMASICYKFNINVCQHNSQRGTCICAHAWIFFELCILITHYIQTTKMYLSNKIVKKKAYEATLTYSTFEVVPVSKLLCPKSMVLLFL